MVMPEPRWFTKGRSGDVMVPTHTLSEMTAARERETRLYADDLRAEANRLQTAHERADKLASDAEAESAYWAQAAEATRLLDNEMREKGLLREEPTPPF